MAPSNNIFKLYARVIWHYDQVNVNHIRKAVDLFPWEKALRNLKMNDMIFLFSKTVKYIISNYIPRETVTFDVRDPPWINKIAKQLILEKNEIYKIHVKENKNPKIFNIVKCLQNQLSSIIESTLWCLIDVPPDD